MCNKAITRLPEIGCKITTILRDVEKYKVKYRAFGLKILKTMIPIVTFWIVFCNFANENNRLW